MPLAKGRTLGLKGDRWHYGRNPLDCAGPIPQTAIRTNPHEHAHQRAHTFLVIILVLYLVNMLPLDGRATQIVRVIVIIIGAISLLKYLAVF